MELKIDWRQAYHYEFEIIGKTELKIHKVKNKKQTLIGWYMFSSLENLDKFVKLKTDAYTKQILSKMTHSKNKKPAKQSIYARWPLFMM